ncbi:MAG: septal ring lytic transglycosylase RlpA family protein [Pedobacter sp.]
MKALIFILFSFISMASASAQNADLQKDSIQINTIQKDSILTDSIRIVRGKATYYASKFHGRRTTSGEVFSNNKMTAAHLTLPFGTMVRVTNIDNGRTVDVRVNDRGPHNKSFIIDISQAAAKEIGIYSRGVGNVEIRYALPR